MTPQRFRKITGNALFALTVIVVTGTAVRLTESGLGCSDWPTCEEDQLIADFSFHPMVEFINRVFTGFVSLAVILAVLGALVRVPRRKDLVWLALGLVAGVIGQIILGAFVVKSHLNPWLVLNHFLLSMVLVANATVLHARAGYDPVPVDPTPRAYKWPITGLTIAAIIAGTFVTGSGPHTGSYDGDAIERLPFAVPDIARVHGGIVIALVLTVIATMWHLRRTNAPGAEQWRGRLVLLALLLQAGIGYTQYFTGVPVLLVGFHIAGATACWIAVLWFHLNLSPEPQDLTTDDTEPAEPARLATADS
jgi:cytochrome c oxidase assembly protein subunit 15